MQMQAQGSAGSDLHIEIKPRTLRLGARIKAFSNTSCDSQRIAHGIGTTYLHKIQRSCQSCLNTVRTLVPCHSKGSSDETWAKPPCQSWERPHPFRRQKTGRESRPRPPPQRMHTNRSLSKEKGSHKGHHRLDGSVPAVANTARRWQLGPRD